MPKNRYKLLRGAHTFREQNEAGQVVNKVVRRGEIFETEQDLTPHNIPGSPPKFELVNPLQEVPEPAEADLSSMTIAQLKALANENDIDLEGVTKKDDIIEILEGELD